MQLEYIYVEEYGPLLDREIRVCGSYEIKKIGQQFEVHKTSFPSNFYSESKLKLTAFFGRNGSGKTTATELLKLIYQADINELPEGITVLFSIEEELYLCTTSSQKLVYYYEGRRLEVSDWSVIEQCPRGLIYYSPVSEPLSIKSDISPTKEFAFLDVSNAKLKNRLCREDGMRQDVKAIFELFKIDIQLNGLKESSAPMRVALSVDRKLSRLRRFLNSGVKVNIVNCVKSIKTEFGNGLTKSEIFDLLNSHLYGDYSFFENIESFVDLLHTTLASESSPIEKYFYLKFGQSHVDSILSALNGSLDLRELLYTSLFFHQFFDYQKKLKSDDFFHKIGWVHGRLNSLIEDHIKISAEQSVFIRTNHATRDIDASLAVSELLYNFEKHGSLEGNTINLDIADFKSFNYLNNLLDSARGLFPPIRFSWKSISSGEYSCLTLFSRLYEAAQNIDVKENIFVIIDEGEISLHPELQRTYVNMLIKNMEKLFSSFNQVNVLITSHSPLILSDIPSHSLNMMDSQNAQGYFGANLYDLFGNGFAVDNILSEFAFKKIGGCIERARDHDKTHEVEDEYIAMETKNPMVKKVLLSLANEKKNND